MIFPFSFSLSNHSFFLLPFDRGARVFIMKFFTCDISFPFSLLISYFLFPISLLCGYCTEYTYNLLCIIIFVFLLISLFSFLSGDFELNMHHQQQHETRVGLDLFPSLPTREKHKKHGFVLTSSCSLCHESDVCYIVGIFCVPM